MKSGFISWFWRPKKCNYPGRSFRQISANLKVIRYGSLRSPTAPASPPPAPISSREREPPSRIYTGRISAFMAWQSKWSGWISRLIGIPNFRAHHSNSHRFFALTTGFGVEQSNLRGVERS
ncbi:hypothetical protein AVEN_170320-1 [Araneus ventricosus]|uniref:Uncharacterized protein n=1 Tax=Araneus ventricosus TaxID=182803 RepID=A0A4Y2CBM6_ARAVE|nr:hypothetical protein AVEN_170320-1 [Araneus ventricosus]